MVAVTQQSMWDVVEPLTEEKRLQVYNFAIKLNEPESASSKVSGKEGREALERMRQHVQDIGLPELTLDEINAEIAEVRKERRERKAVTQ